MGWCRVGTFTKSSQSLSYPSYRHRSTLLHVGLVCATYGRQYAYLCCLILSCLFKFSTEMNARQRPTITFVLTSPRDEAKIDYPFHLPYS
ncbi:uncharacterized protein BO96DRAFT_78161 [Aspergillus niger CBS 101883]|uniref:uncharacterized protein n=1 Tax=Aspergillus lacticoffeatus (strain CBS 101883) TaxID=1450533 RepID=UPI000D8038B9|nr:uncharacterized protein BO96DRAFT_78161 [Aspergillus niger CBS 101883]PYH55072.1 hypothetical protein BO96DRAFT_78161 [Aspergillus niger CBS 101883]